MTMAVTKAVEEGSRAIICASTGNTSASAAAYAARAGISRLRADPGRQDRTRQAGSGHDPRRGGDPDPRQLRCRHAAGQGRGRTRAGDHRQFHQSRIACRARRPPPSRSSKSWNARRTITACRSATPATSPRTGWATASIPARSTAPAPARACITPSRSPAPPVMVGYQASGAAPFLRGEMVDNPETVATAIRIGHPQSLGQGLEGAEGIRRLVRRMHRRGNPRRAETAHREGRRVLRTGLRHLAGRARCAISAPARFPKAAAWSAP